MVARARFASGTTIPAAKKITGSPFDPLVNSLFPKLARIVPKSISPNAITVLGGSATIAAGAALAFSGWTKALLLVASGLIFFNWIADTLDGVVARQRSQCTKLGDFLDHAFDAVSAAALTIGPAFSGHCNPVYPLLLGVLFLLSFAFTYKGEQATGVYELLKLGPTEVRFAAIGVLMGTYFLPGPVLTIWGQGLTVLDLGSILGCIWSFFYAIVIFRRYTRRLVETPQP